LTICTECHVNTCFNIHLSPKTISNINKHDSYLGLKCLYIFLRQPVYCAVSVRSVHYPIGYMIGSATSHVVNYFVRRKIMRWGLHYTKIESFFWKGVTRFLLIIWTGRYPTLSQSGRLKREYEVGLCRKRSFN
jgi:hypothetical protein